MSTVPARSRTTDDQQADAAALVERLTARIERLEEQLAEMGRYIETDRLVVTAPNGVIEIGAVSRGTAAGVVVQGRGACFGLHAALAVDDCTHSTDLAPEARVEVASSAGLVVARSPESPTRAPDLTVGVGAEYAVQLTARHCGFDEGVDITGGWRGAVLVADDVTDREMASIEAALLDDVAGKVWSSDRWERTEDVR